MGVFRTHHTEGYTVIPNAAMQEPSLSYRARGVLGNLLSRPPEWETSADRLAAESPTEGREAVLTALRELDAAGYVVRRQVRDEGGRLQTVTDVFDTPGHTEDEAQGYDRATAGLQFTAADGSTGDGSADSGADLRKHDEPAGHAGDGSAGAGQPVSPISTEEESTEGESTTSADAAGRRETRAERLKRQAEAAHPRARDLCRQFALGAREHGHPIPADGSTSFHGWIVDMDLLIRRGPEGGEPTPTDPDEIASVIAWVVTDVDDTPGRFPGEAAVVRSPSRLRQRYSELRMKAQRSPVGPGQPSRAAHRTVSTHTRTGRVDLGGRRR